uniref:Uncharacterized protein n=1 Tax=viral metagenome TaxID=1070528 RepID=A0A6M3JNL3_9ZZZZ
MDIVCAWCKKKIGEKDGGENDDLVTSSICSECSTRILREEVPEERKSVDLIARGYEWYCPHCEAYNTVVEIPKAALPVVCERCGLVFTVAEVRHARG